MTQEEIAAECNVNRATLDGWHTRNRACIEYRREVTRNYISDMSGLFLKSLRRSIEGTNGTPSMKALDLFAKVEGFVQTSNQLDVNIGTGGRSNDDLEDELAKLEEQLAEIDEGEGDN